jgi:hypothetical protein
MNAVRGIATPNQTETIRAWNITYLDSPHVFVGEDTFLFVDDKGNCLGYADISCNEILSIDWFCAPRNGALCLKLLLGELALLYPHMRFVKLLVTCDNSESEKAIQARLNLYYAHGFKIVHTLWITTRKQKGPVNFTMHREL